MTHRRLGFIVPSVNAVFETDCRRGVPLDYGVYVARASCARDDEGELAALVRRAPVAARDLRDAAVDAIAFACTSGSLLEGQGYDDEIVREITAAAGVPATTSATAVRDAVLSVAATNVALVTPYEPWLNARMVTYLASAGIGTAASFGFGMPDPRDHEAIAPAVIADRAMDLCTADVDAVVISCTSFRGMEAAALVRQRQGRPVVSSNEATAWAAAHLLGEGSETFHPHIGASSEEQEGRR